MTAKRLTREQIEDMQDRRHWTPLTPDQVNALCDMALAALRAQQNGVVVPREMLLAAKGVLNRSKLGHHGWIKVEAGAVDALREWIAAAEKEAK